MGASNIVNLHNALHVLCEGVRLVDRRFIPGKQVLLEAEAAPHRRGGGDREASDEKGEKEDVGAESEFHCV